MRRWQATALIVGAAALFLTARPAQAQVWVGPPVGVVPGPVVVSSGWGARPYWGARRAYPVGVVPGPVVVNTGWSAPVGVVPGPVVTPVRTVGFVPGPVVTPVPPIGVVPGPVVVSPGWGATPRDVRRANRAARRGWPATVWAPGEGVVVAGRPW